MGAMSLGGISLAVILLHLHYCLAQVTITNDIDTTSVRRSQYKHSQTLLDILASDAGGGGVICSLDPPVSGEDFFKITKLGGDTNYHIDFKPKTPTPVEIDNAITEVTLTGSCKNSAEENDTFTVVVYIQENEPPVVTVGPTGKVEIANVLLDTGEGVIIGKVVVSDADNDPLTFTPVTAVDGFEIDAGGNVKTTKHLAELDTGTFEITGKVGDGENADVDFSVIITLDKLNLKPEDPGVITTITVPENVPTEIYTMNVNDLTVFPDISVSLVVTPTSGASLFTVESGNVIKAVGPFDFDTLNKYDLKVTVSDGYKSSQYDIEVNIADGNDVPQCPSPVYLRDLAEGPNAELDIGPFVIVDNADDSSTFLIEPASLGLVVISQNPLKIGFTTDLDCESSPDTIVFNLTLTDTLGAVGFCTFHVTCLDVNDEDPKFDTETYIFTVSTDMGTGTSIGKVIATDADKPDTDNSKVEYSLETDDPAGVVEVQTNGDVIIKSGDLQQYYDTLVKGTVTATDKGSPPRKGTADFKFQWNQRPTIKDLPPQVSLSEDTNGEKLVQVLTAEDPEGDPVTFTAYNVSDSAPFIVKEVSGEYGVYYDGTKALNMLSVKDIDVGVMVEDGKGGHSFQVLTIKLIPNALPEVLCTAGVSTSVNVPDVQNEDVVYNIPVTDPNGDPISVSGPCVPDLNLFIVNSADLTVVATKTMLDITEPSVVCNLTINDDKHLPSESQSCLLTIVLTNHNEAPKFTNSGVKETVGELTDVDTVLYTFDITDTEPVTVSYEIFNSSGSSFFEVDTDTHQVKLKSKLDFETMDEKEFVIVMTANDGYLTSSGSVTIEVFDENDPPIFSQELYITTLDEGPKPDNGTDFGLLATDTDNDTVTYKVLAPHNDKFILEDGKLKNIVELDLDADSSNNVYNIKVEASDSKGTTTADVTITVQFVNDNEPEFDADVFPNCVIGASTAVSSAICSGTATDADAAGDDSTLVYSIGASSHSAQFDVLGNDIVLKSPMPAAEYGSLVYVEVIARDKGDPSLFTAKNVTFSWNKPPTCVVPADVYIHENAGSPLDVIDSAITMDDGSPDEEDVVTATLFCSPENDVFQAKKTSDTSSVIEYSSSKALSFNDNPLFQCTVTCDDEQGGTDVHDITIHVTKNKAPDPKAGGACPVTKSVDPNVNKPGPDAIANLPLGTVVDPEDDDLTYIADRVPYFSVNEQTGAVTINDNLAKQTTDTVTIPVTMKDPYDNTAVCQVIITINPLNEPPVVTPIDDIVQVDENTDIGVLANIDFTDDLLCDNAVSISKLSVDPNDQSADFLVKIEEQAVTITNLQELDHEDRETYKFYITLTDGCRDIAITRTLKIMDVNEPPEFRGPVVLSSTFKENDTGVCRSMGCEVWDEDEVDDLTVEITAGKYKDNFYVKAETCELCMIEEVDMDKPKMDLLEFDTDLTLKVTDKDKETDDIDVKVTIQEVNEHTPRFDKSAYNAKVSSTDNEGTEVIVLVPDLTTVDDDNLHNGEVTCAAGNDCDPRMKTYINIGSDCKVTVSSSLAGQLATGTVFKCDVDILDNGSPQLKSTTKLDIQYEEITTPPPPPTTTEDPNADADANANANAGAGAGTGGSGSGIDQALNKLGSGSGSGSGALSVGAIAGMAVGALAAGAILATGLVFGISYCMKNCGKSGASSGVKTQSYRVGSGQSSSRITNNRVTSSSSVRIGNMNEYPSNGKTNVKYGYP